MFGRIDTPKGRALRIGVVVDKSAAVRGASAPQPRWIDTDADVCRCKNCIKREHREALREKGLWFPDPEAHAAFSATLDRLVGHPMNNVPNALYARWMRTGGNAHAFPPALVSAMLTGMSILIFLAVLFVLVLVHELGHFWTAKKVGMRVDEFGIGFPPKVASITKGGTEYSLNALPIGGFVRIYGEDMVGEDGAPATGTGAFSEKPKWAQALVLIAGVAANVLFAWLLFVVALGIGVPTVVETATASDEAALHILSVLPDSPASAAGIPSGARVIDLAIGTETHTPQTPEAFRALIHDAGDTPITITYSTGAQTETRTITAAEGVVEHTAAIGVSLGLVESRSLPIHEAAFEAFMLTITGLRDITLGLVSLLAQALALNADLSSVAGPVGIVGLVGDASSAGFTALLMFTAFISLNLAVINLFPFPALDGGRLLFVLIEAVKGSPIPARVSYYANATGFLLLLLLMVVITFNDIARLV